MRMKHVSRFWAFLILLFLFTFLFGCGQQAFMDDPLLSIQLLGQQHLQLEHGSHFDDPGATALWDGSIPVEAVPVNQLDTQQLGLQKLCYRASCNGLLRTVYRYVEVVDTTPPVITLVSDPSYFTLPGQPYTEEGFTAWDSCDGDITALVQRVEDAGSVIYTVTDASGNIATVTRTIAYDDTAPPVLTLLGAEALTIRAGAPFTDPGCKAMDNADGDLSEAVTVSGAVDIYMPGIYELTYSATDSWGNTAQVIRTVTVAFPTSLTPANPNGKVIYLTFDDGPGPYTDRLLDVLAKYQVKATFFVINSGYISTVSRIAAEGHTVAIHSATHKYAQIYASEEAYFADLTRMQSIIEEHTGTRPMILRFPGGSSNNISCAYNQGIMTRLTQAVKAQGYRYFDWNVDSDDAGRAASAEEVFNNVVKGIGNRKNSIVLQHDIMGFSVDAVERIINWGLANGYTFRALDMSSPACEHNVYN